jgi:hypothetical protein
VLVAEAAIEAEKVVDQEGSKVAINKTRKTPNQIPGLYTRNNQAQVRNLTRLKKRNADMIWAALE